MRGTFFLLSAHRRRYNKNSEKVNKHVIWKCESEIHLRVLPRSFYFFIQMEQKRIAKNQQLKSEETKTLDDSEMFFYYG